LLTRIRPCPFSPPVRPVSLYEIKAVPGFVTVNALDAAVEDAAKVTASPDPFRARLPPPVETGQLSTLVNGLPAPPSASFNRRNKQRKTALIW
jgi:hypothetical protein